MANDKLFHSGQAILRSYRTLKDRSLVLSLETPELRVEEVASIHNFLGDQVAFALATDMTTDIISSLDTTDFSIEEDKRSPSQQTRAIIYRLWEYKGQPGTFEVYYRSTMEKIHVMLKKQLPPAEGPR